MSDRFGADRDKPRSIMFFPNGLAAVFDGTGRQMPQYQAGWHGATIAALAADGIDWRAIPDREGRPMTQPPSWWTPEKERAYQEERETTT